jgi:hypothetical protein
MYMEGPAICYVPQVFPGLLCLQVTASMVSKLQVVTPFSIKPPAFKFGPLLWQQTDCFSKFYVPPVILN